MPQPYIKLADQKNDEEDIELLVEDHHEDAKENKFSSKFDPFPQEKQEFSYYYKKLIELAKPEFWYLVFGTASLLIGSIVFLALPYYIGGILDASIRVKDKETAHSTLTKTIIELFILMTLVAVFVLIRSYFFTISGERVVARLRKDVFAQVLKQEISFFDHIKTGDLINRLASDTTVLQNTVTVNISQGLRTLVGLLGGIFMLLYLSWKVCLVMAIFLPMIIVASVIYGKFVKHLSKDFQEQLAKSAEIATEAISNIRTVRSFSKEEYEVSNYAVNIDKSFELAKKRSWGFGLFSGGVAFFANFGIVACLWYGGYLVIEEELTPGQLASFLIYIISVAASLGSLTALYGDMMSAIGASERIFQIMDRVPLVRFRGGKELSNLKGKIQLNDVQFSYPSRPDTLVLKGFNLTLNPGEMVALVGHSGSGKTTVVSLLEQFYLPTGGEITIDGTPMNEVDPVFLHTHIGIVSQEPSLFAATVAQNIAYGIDISRERIIEAAKLANAHEFIMEFPDGYDTQVGERGIRVSGGQKQRIAIARALLTSPQILLLDEATSALDTESEYLVKQALDKLMEGRTTLVIAHRLSTVKKCNLVCVVSDGKVVEQGSHEELIQKNGKYRKLLDKQMIQE